MRPTHSDADEARWPRYDAATTPLYLPRNVTALKIKAGHPIGMTEEGYWVCQDHHELDDIGYYYVKHPAGDYCEPKPRQQ